MEKEKRKMSGYFMIVNLVVAIFAFSSMIGLVSADDFGESIAVGDSTSTSVAPGISTPPSTTATPTGTIVNPTGTNINPGATGTVVGDGGTEGDTTGPIGIDDGPTGPIDPTGDGIGPTGPPPGVGGVLNFLNFQTIQKMVYYGGVGAGMFGTLGALGGGDDGATWGALAGAIGGAVTGLAEAKGMESGPAILLGLGIGTLIFILTYRKSSTQITEFYCLPWQAPIGGQYCEGCNKYEDCTEYTCKSLGQACEIINQGSKEQRCVWQNPHDVKSPILEFKGVSRDHRFNPDQNARPPGNGVVITRTDKECIRAFFPLEFEFETSEPAQCKVDYLLTESTQEEPRGAYDNMNFYVNGDNLYKYNHTEKLSLPGPDAINAENPEIKNNGEYTLFIRCQDANGNFNQDAFSVSFCIDSGPDTTPPIVVNTNIPSGNPVQYNQTSFDLEVYTNEPSECKWSRTDQNYDNMEKQMECDTRVWQMNNQNVYTCRTTLTGILDRIDNNYFFRCKDQPRVDEGDRNVNVQSYPYVLQGTQPLNIMKISPNGTLKGATEVIPAMLEVNTDNGHENGEALCYYYNDADNTEPENDEGYVLFHETTGNVHIQRQDLVAGDYVYYIKCVDLGGNAVYSSTRFTVETDRQSPLIVRVYRENQLKIITNEGAVCSYSNNDCNFEIDSGIEMNGFDGEIHTAEWILNRNYYIRCKDSYENQPFPNTCSIIVRPSDITAQDSEDEEWTFDW